MRVAINGFGRIGKCIVRAIFENNLEDEIEIVKINSSCSNIEMEAHLLRYDTVHGKFKAEVKTQENKLVINKTKIEFSSSKKNEDINWQNIDLLFECTGAFLTKEKAIIHTEKGAKKVIISSPVKDNSIKTIILKVNETKLDKVDNIISIGSCTTNCLAPFLKIINDKIGVEKGFATTIHSYTNDQNIVDGYHKNDFRRARAAACSMIPTSSGVSKAIEAVIPELKSKIDGSSIRVPVPNISLIDFTFVSKRDLTKEELNNLIKQSAKKEFQDIIKYTEEELVSCDFIGTNESCVFDSKETRVTDGNFCRVCLWYDNEWAFSLRMIELAQKMNKI